MLDSAGGGGGGSTYFYGISPDVMWAWVNRDLTPHYEQATAWKKASELAGLYSSRLQTFRDKLAQAWNPDTSPASQAYLTRLDDLITAVKDVDLVAGRNYQASVNIPNAISEAKYKLEPIYNRFKQAEVDYDVEDPGSRSTAADSPANRYNDAWNEAAGVMYSLATDLSQSQYGLAKPAPYKPPGTIRPIDDDYYIGGEVGPPVIPPVMPIAPSAVPPTMPTGPVSPFPGPKAPDLQTLTPNIPAPGGPPSVGTPPGPVSPHAPTPGGPLPPGGVIPKPGPAGGVPVPPRGAPPMPGQLGGLPPQGPAGRPGTPGPGVIGGGPANTGRPAGGARANPVGGMIGGPASGRAGGIGPVGPGGAGAAGGVAGGGRGPAGRGPGVGGAGAAGRGGGVGAMGMAGARGSGHPDEDGEHFDPDTQWDVAHGVAPVLDAPEEDSRPIDPGPAIGLSR